MQVEIREIPEKQAQRRLSGQEGFEVCFIGGVGSAGTGSSWNYRQRLQKEHEGQRWGLQAKCWGKSRGAVERPGRLDCPSDHHGPWLTHEWWEASPLSLHFIISVRINAVKSNPVQPPERGNIEN